MEILWAKAVCMVSASAAAPYVRKQDMKGRLLDKERELVKHYDTCGRGSWGENVLLSPKHVFIRTCRQPSSNVCTDIKNSEWTWTQADWDIGIFLYYRIVIWDYIFTPPPYLTYVATAKRNLVRKTRTSPPKCRKPVSYRPDIRTMAESRWSFF